MTPLDRRSFLQSSAVGLSSLRMITSSKAYSTEVHTVASSLPQRYGKTSSRLSFQSFWKDLPPNPFHHQATLNTIAPGVLKIYNPIGTFIREDRVNNSTTINRDGLEDGIYIYELVNNKGVMARGKFIVN